MALYDADASRDRDLQVQDFFSDPERYRRRNVDLPIRPTIVRGLVGDCAGKSILDLGCGDGSLTLPLCGGASRLVLLDRSSAMLDTARRDTPVDCLGRVFYVEMDLTAYEPDETFDLVVCVGVLAHVRSIPDAIDQVARLVSPGGRCVIQLTDGSRPLALLLHAAKAASRWRGDGTSHTLNFMTAASVTNIARSVDLLLVERQYYSIILPGLNRLPASWRERYAAWTIRHPLPHLSSEVMLLFGSPDTVRAAGGGHALTPRSLSKRL